PGRKSAIVYWPRASVSTARDFSIGTGLLASTVTPGRTAPEVSFAAPAMALCAAAGAGSANHTRATSDASETLRRMFPSLLERVEPNGTPTAPHHTAHQHALPNTQVPG